MAQTKLVNNKKRSANSKLQNKPAKALKTQPGEDHVEEKEEGLFDNLDEEMDPSEVEDIVNKLNEDSESEEDIDEEDVDEEDKNDDDEIEDAEQASNDEDEMIEDDKEDNIPVSNEQQSTAKKFRDLYMTKVTQAFGSDLDQIRQEPNLNGPRLNILIDSLEAGIDIFSNLEQEIILADEEQ
ncbi:hypothetical protein MAM1_0278d09143 [Mucor ambiguus]|uniref:Ribosome assembly protein 3 n=1 Tax=Mucor ambiguus TaxID=91626 RepID=A0A0C9N107_9FUNG|nr:hypothetical protein MAM1_0278d09143 [Mucor ambiguus]